MEPYLFSVLVTPRRADNLTPDDEHMREARRLERAKSAAERVRVGSRRLQEIKECVLRQLGR